MFSDFGDLLKTKTFWVSVVKVIAALAVYLGFLGDANVNLDGMEATVFEWVAKVLPILLGFWGLDGMTKRSTEIKREKRERGLV